jgi:hypothetical protein
MFGLWERKGKSGEPLPEANDGPPDSHRPSGLCLTSNRASMQRAICPTHSTVERLIRRVVSPTRPRQLRRRYVGDLSSPKSHPSTSDFIGSDAIVICST